MSAVYTIAAYWPFGGRRTLTVVSLDDAVRTVMQCLSGGASEVTVRRDE